jgi:hypothetical protein
MGHRGVSPLQQELRDTEALTVWVRGQLYGVASPERRARATTAIAAAAAQEAYRLSDELSDLANAASEAWREHLVEVWAFVAGDTTQHYALSAAIADYLSSPLNHNEGQDGPDDFDRPQTIASYSAAMSAIAWGVDFATTAVQQIFDCIDLKHNDDYPPERASEVRQEIVRVRGWTNLVTAAEALSGIALSPDLLARLKKH